MCGKGGEEELRAGISEVGERSALCCLDKNEDEGNRYRNKKDHGKWADEKKGGG